MNNGPDFSALGQVYPQAKSIVCCIHPQTTYDAVAAATALCLAAREAGKSCEVLCEEPMRVEYNYLVGIDKIQQSIGNRDLVISFDYNEEQVDKVSYNIDEQNQRFELIIAPKSGALPLDPSTIQFNRSGLSADLIFLFGFHGLDELGEVYEKEKHTIDRAYTVAFTQNKIQNFAKLHMALRPDNFSYSEMVYFLIRQLQMAEVKEDIATNLLSGIEYATERFMQPNLPARVFETVANLLRQGAQRQPENPAYDHLNTPIREVENTAPVQPAGPTMGPQLAGSYNQPMMGQPGLDAQVRPMNQPVPQAVRPANNPSGEVQPAVNQDGGQGSQPVSASEFARAMQGGGRRE